MPVKIPVFQDHWTTGEPQRADTNTYSGYVHHGNISPPPSGMANTAKKFGCRESNNNSPPGNAVPNQNPQQSAERKLPTVTQNSYTIGNYVPLGASYYASNDTIGYFFDNEIGEKVQFTDFKLTFVEKQRHISFDANFSDHYRILLTDALEEKHDLLVYHESLGDLYSTIEHKCPECQLFTDVVAGCREKFKRLVGILLKLQRPPLVLLYKRWGWGNLENGIHEETLLTFQNDQTLMQHLCGCFIHFVEQQYAQIVDYIKHQFVKLREESSISEPRMLDTYIHFKVVLDVLVKCLYFYGCVNSFV